jgi:hypothetical protein
MSKPRKAELPRTMPLSCAMAVHLSCCIAVGVDPVGRVVGLTTELSGDGVAGEVEAAVGAGDGLEVPGDVQPLKDTTTSAMIKRSGNTFLSGA